MADGFGFGLAEFYSRMNARPTGADGRYRASARRALIRVFRRLRRAEARAGATRRCDRRRRFDSRLARVAARAPTTGSRLRADVVATRLGVDASRIMQLISRVRPDPGRERAEETEAKTVGGRRRRRARRGAQHPFHEQRREGGATQSRARGAERDDDEAHENHLNRHQRREGFGNDSRAALRELGGESSGAQRAARRALHAVQRSVQVCRKCFKPRRELELVAA